MPYSKFSTYTKNATFSTGLHSSLVLPHPSFMGSSSPCGSPFLGGRSRPPTSSLMTISSGTSTGSGSCVFASWSTLGKQPSLCVPSGLTRRFCLTLYTRSWGIPLNKASVTMTLSMWSQTVVGRPSWPCAPWNWGPQPKSLSLHNLGTLDQPQRGSITTMKIYPLLLSRSLWHP